MSYRDPWEGLSHDDDPEAREEFRRLVHRKQGIKATNNEVHRDEKAERERDGER